MCLLLKGLTKDNISAETAVGDLEYDPVSRAIARHMGIDLSPEGKAALNRRGIAIIVHGAPLSGKMSGKMINNLKKNISVCSYVKVSICVQVKQGQQLLWLSTMGRLVSV